MLSFKDLQELLEPKAAGEKRFKDKHVVGIVDHPLNDAETLKGTKKSPGKKKRIADSEEGKDAAVYEELEQDDLNDLMQYALDEGLDFHELTEEHLDELIGGLIKKGIKKVGGAIKNRVTTSGRAERLKKKATAMQKKRNDTASIVKSKKTISKIKNKNQMRKRKLNNSYEENITKCKCENCGCEDCECETNEESLRATYGESWKAVMYATKQAMNESVIDKVKEIASKKSAKKIDGVMVDSFTASAISQIYDKVNDANKKKMDSLPIIKLANLAFKMMQKNEFVPEEVGLDEGPMDGFLRLTFKSPADVKKAMKVSDTEFGKRHFNMDKARTRPEIDFEGDKDDLQNLKDALKSAGIKFEIDLEEEEVDEAAPMTTSKQDATTKRIKKRMKDKKEEDELDEYGGNFGGGPMRVTSGKKKKDKKEDIDEAKEKSARQLIDPNKEVMVVKKNKVIVIDKKDQDKYIKQGYSLAEASARADAMKAMRKGKSVDPADVDNTATDDDVKAASKNILMQLRKAVNLRGTFAVEFGDKKKVKVSAKIAQAVQNKYNSLNRPAEKEKFQTQIAKSYKDLLKAIKEETVKESKISLINKQLKGEK